MRYYYTLDGCSPTDQTFVCYFAQIGSSLISGSFVSTTGTNADEYLEVSFLAGAGMLAPGANTGQIQASFHSTDYQCNFNQTNDYSFDATKTAFTTWSNVTLYQSGTLVWGTEP
jgi:endo-1,4-beta-xylanase